MPRCSAITSGQDLRLARLRVRVTATDVAREIGVSKQRVHQVEALAVVSDAAAERYVSGLERNLAARTRAPRIDVSQRLVAALTTAYGFGGSDE